MKLTPAGARKVTRKITAEMSRSPLISVRMRCALLRYSGIELDGDVDVKERVRFVSRRTSLGDGSMVGRECFFEDHAPVRVGRNVWMGARCVFMTATHEPGAAMKRAGHDRAEAIAVEDGCWLGAAVVVLPGVTIGAGCIVAAGTVVTRDCEPNGLYAGVPAQRKRDLPA